MCKIICYYETHVKLAVGEKYFLLIFTFLKLKVYEDFFQEMYLYFPAMGGKGTAGICGINQVLVKQAEVGQIVTAFFHVSSDVAHRRLIITFPVST